MQIDLDNAKKEFRRLDRGERMLELLLSLHENAELTPDDRGWALWNICDLYACAREASTQHKYQSQFFELARSSFPERAHWVVSDGTQALTLTHGGFGHFWSGCYDFANENAPRVAENRTVRFESHRANAGFCTKHDHLGQFRNSALEAMASLLEEDPGWRNREFAGVTYMTLLVDFYGATGQVDKVNEAGKNLESVLDEWLARSGDVQSVRPKDEPLSGSWQGINADRPPTAVLIGVHNAACAFTRLGLFPAGERLFRIRWDRGPMPTAYGEALFLLSCWRNRQSKDEIIHLLDQCTRVTPMDLRKFAPEVADVVREP